MEKGRSDLTRCLGCGLLAHESRCTISDRYNASGECLQMYGDLLCYTVARQDAEFIHQHAVDAYAAQHSGGTTRNITVAFGLIGLYLALEKGYAGKQVQQAHMQIAQIRKNWPRLEPPPHTAEITVIDVLQERTDAEKDVMIWRWMAAVWESCKDRQEWVRETTDELVGRAHR